MNRDEIFGQLGLTDANSGVFAGEWLAGSGGDLTSENPSTTDAIATVRKANLDEYEQVVASSQETFKEWRMLPAPQRGHPDISYAPGGRMEGGEAGWG